MKQQYFIQKKIHYLNEAILLLSSFSLGENRYQTLQQESYALGEDTPEKALLQELDAIRYEIQQNLDLPWERVAVYCSEFETGGSVSVASLLFPPLYGTTLIEVEETFANFSEEHIHEQIYLHFLGLEDLWTEDVEPTSMTQGQLISQIINSGLSDTKKLEYIEVVSDIEAARTECGSYLSSAIEAMSPYAPRLEEIAQKYGGNLLQKTKAEGLFEQRIQVSSIEGPIAVFPLVLSPNIGGIYALENPLSGTTAPTVLFYGILIDYLLELSQNRTPLDERVTAILRILGDNTKQQILYALQYKPLYGQQIADMTDLTTATVSYHMGILLNEGLVSVEKESVRSYYSLNSKVLDQRLEDVKVYFGLSSQEPTTQPQIIL